MSLTTFLYLGLFAGAFVSVSCEYGRQLGPANEALVADYNSVLLDTRYNIRGFWRRSIDSPDTHIDLAMMAPGRVYIATSFGARMSMLTTVGSRGIGPVVIGLLAGASGNNYVIPGVYQYNINGYSLQNTHLLSDDLQTISEGSITYDGDSTLLRFRRPYAATGHPAERAIPTDEIALMGWTWAVGPGANYVYHGGNFGFRFIEMDVRSVEPGPLPSPDQPITLSASPSPSPAGNSSPSSTPSPSPSVSASPLPDADAPCDSAAACMGRGKCVRAAGPNSNGQEARWYCRCDPGYTGSRCHLCALGFAETSTAPVECAFLSKQLPAELKMQLPIYLKREQAQSPGRRLAVERTSQTQIRSRHTHYALHTVTSWDLQQTDEAPFWEKVDEISEQAEYSSSKQWRKRKKHYFRASASDEENLAAVEELKSIFLGISIDHSSSSSDSRQISEQKRLRQHGSHDPANNSRRLQSNSQDMTDILSPSAMAFLQQSVVEVINSAYESRLVKSLKDSSVMEVDAIRVEDFETLIVDDDSVVVFVPLYISTEEEFNANQILLNFVKGLLDDVTNPISLVSSFLRLELSMIELVNVNIPPSGDNNPGGNVDSLWSGRFVSPEDWNTLSETPFLASYLPSVHVFLLSRPTYSLSMRLSSEAHLQMERDEGRGVVYFRLRSSMLTWTGVAVSPSESMIGGDAITIEPGKQYPNEVTTTVLNGYTMSEIETVSKETPRIGGQAPPEPLEVYIRGLCPLYSLWYVTASGSRISSHSVTSMRIMDAGETLKQLRTQQTKIWVELVDGEFVFSKQVAESSPNANLIVGYEAIFCRSIAAGSYPGAREMGNVSPSKQASRRLASSQIDSRLPNNTHLTDEREKPRFMMDRDSEGMGRPAYRIPRALKDKYMELSNQTEAENYTHAGRKKDRKLKEVAAFSAENAIFLTWAWGVEGYYYMSTHPIQQSGAAEIDLSSGAIRQAVLKKPLVLGLPSLRAFFHASLSLVAYLILLPAAGFAGVCARKRTSVPGPLASYTRAKRSLWQAAALISLISLILGYTSRKDRLMSSERNIHELFGLLTFFCTQAYTVLDLYMKRRMFSFHLTHNRPNPVPDNRSDNIEFGAYSSQARQKKGLQSERSGITERMGSHATGINSVDSQQSILSRTPKAQLAGEVALTSSQWAENSVNQVEVDPTLHSLQSSTSRVGQAGGITSGQPDNRLYLDGSRDSIGNEHNAAARSHMRRLVVGRKKPFRLLWYIRTYLGRVTIALGLVTCFLASVRQTTCHSSLGTLTHCWSNSGSTSQRSIGGRVQAGHGWLLFSVTAVAAMAASWLMYYFLQKRVKPRV